MNSSVHFKVIVPMYNCELWAVSCLNSVLSQTYTDWQVVVCVEPCDDKTWDVVSAYLKEKKDPRFCLIKNETRKGVPKNHIDCIRASNPQNEDVIVLLDGDDKLFGTDVLTYLNEVYSTKPIWITWGSYIFEHSNKRGLASQAVPVKNDPHKGERWWRFSHLKTFKYFLFKGIQDSDLRYTKTGDYYKVAGDMALMFPMVEMAGASHSLFVEKILYVYNQSTPYNDEKVQYPLVRACDDEIRKRPRYPEKTKEELCRILA